jgi:hypothetical protein
VGREGVRTLSATEVAVIIRGQLRRAFPGQKFSVRSKSFAGGSSVDIYWTDGPLTEQVEAVVKRWERKGFDGMTDSTYYRDPIEWQGERVMAYCWVMAQRTWSLEHTRERYEATLKKWGLTNTYEEKSYTYDGVEHRYLMATSELDQDSMRKGSRWFDALAHADERDDSALACSRIESMLES